MSNLDNNIMKELDRYNFSGIIISKVMKSLTTIDLKNKFLNYMINSRNILLSEKDIICYIELELLKD